MPHGDSFSSASWWCQTATPFIPPHGGASWQFFYPAPRPSTLRPSASQRLSFSPLPMLCRPIRPFGELSHGILPWIYALTAITPGHSCSFLHRAEAIRCHHAGLLLHGSSPPSLGTSRQMNPHCSYPYPLSLPPFSGLSRQKQECSGAPGSLPCNHSDEQPLHLSDALSPGSWRLK